MTKTDLLIVGAGCAGLTAAVYAIRAGHSAIVLEKGMYGGQIALTSEVENYPSIEKISGVELATLIYNQAVKQGADIRFEEVTEARLGAVEKIVVTTSEEYRARAVILANGVERRKLGCPGEAEFTGRGVSYCATCDGAFFRGKDVAVVGGGNTALEDALFLSNLCRKVYLIHRRDQFRGEKVMVDAVLARDNIEILYQHTVEEILGDKVVTSVRAAGLEDGQRTLDVAAVFVAIGLIPVNQLFAEAGLDANGYLAAGEDCNTQLPGVYAAGDTRSKPLRQIITAASDGAVAAVAASNYLNAQ
ncbi:FAD-dependent oxidoreductase [Clostridiaceae bacterium NSJ-31]|uniref:FAD-dependent oxidoreductase n=1 Tax=Ligaoa zhengdingensis TaxID=2763658 RepID=A0A926DX65_9FIRM|nr:FAD-dependent oxidoreductase [Ligaoa zhengdingensis]MBC8547058.1 FAD-dependent oxidoreductase [Ligaoa zhengdingensis]